ncbi:MAG: 5-formyltetrahydrofolate cyclo-ligase [Lachnospiraceae bacterium]|nr:5-formyltetrahydrofolate cyclo-ligase [Lachnospiraceae bacterium]
MEKKEIRREILKKRDMISLEYRREADEKIFQKLISLKEYKESSLIMPYINYKSEVDTKRLIVQALGEQKRVAVPKVLNRNGEMEFYEITSLEQLISGYKGIEEPDTTGKSPLDIKEESEKVLLIMPGAVFDKQCNRIGYGGGFYDRYLERHSCEKLKSIALCYQTQIVEKIESDTFDQKPDMVLTEKGGLL